MLGQFNINLPSCNVAIIIGCSSFVNCDMFHLYIFFCFRYSVWSDVFLHLDTYLKYYLNFIANFAASTGLLNVSKKYNVDDDRFNLHFSIFLHQIESHYTIFWQSSYPDWCYQNNGPHTVQQYYINIFFFNGFLWVFGKYAFCVDCSHIYSGTTVKSANIQLHIHEYQMLNKF